MINLLLILISLYFGIRQIVIECLKLLSDKDNLGFGMFVLLVKYVLQCEVEIELDQEYLKQVKNIIRNMGQKEIYMYMCNVNMFIDFDFDCFF